MARPARGSLEELFPEVADQWHPTRKPWEFDTAGGMDFAHRFFTTSVLQGPGTGEPISDSMEEIRLALEHAWAQAIQVGILDPSTEQLTKPVDIPLELLAKLEELKKLLSTGLTDLDSRKPPK